MRTFLIVALTLGTAVALTGCGSRSTTTASHDCFRVWNDVTNRPRQLVVARRFVTANVSGWRAEPAGGTANAGGPASEGCGYLFHTNAAYLSISGEWKGESLRWGVPPSIHGAWTQQQQSAVKDNAAVGADGTLKHRH